MLMMFGSPACARHAGASHWSGVPFNLVVAGALSWLQVPHTCWYVHDRPHSHEWTGCICAGSQIQASGMLPTHQVPVVSSHEVCKLNTRKGARARLAVELAELCCLTQLATHRQTLHAHHSHQHHREGPAAAPAAHTPCLAHSSSSHQQLVCAHQTTIYVLRKVESGCKMV
jgi:hypothetical protein